MYQLCGHILFHSPRISNFLWESFGIKGTFRRIAVATRTRGIAREADVGLGNNSAILLRQKRICTQQKKKKKENMHMHIAYFCFAEGELPCHSPTHDYFMPATSIHRGYTNK